MDHGYRLRDMPVSMPPNLDASKAWDAARAVARLPVPVPAPERCSRDGWPEGVDAPGGATQAGNLARREGWRVRWTYARGTRVTERTSARYESVATRCLADSGAVVVVVHVRACAGDADWKLDSVLVRLADGTMVGGCDLAAAKVLVTAGGVPPDGWAEAVRAAAQEREAKKKEAARKRASGGAKRDGGELGESGRTVRLEAMTGDAG